MPETYETRAYGFGARDPYAQWYGPSRYAGYDVSAERGREYEGPFAEMERGRFRPPEGGYAAGGEYGRTLRPTHTWRGGPLGWFGSGVRAAAAWFGDGIQNWGYRLGGRLSGRSAEFGETLRGGGTRMGAALERAQQGVEGMRAPRGYRRADERILDEVCERVTWSGAYAEDVEIQSRDGVVTLSGTVPNRADKRIIEDIAESVFGVQEVHNQLRVGRRTPTEERTREEEERRRGVGGEILGGNGQDQGRTAAAQPTRQP